MPAARLLEFIILTAARSGEARGAIWDEVNLDKGIWEIPAKRMKMKRPHLVPIQGRTLELFKQAKMNDESDLVFPNMRFRSSFKTWALENTNFPTQAVEFALAHETRNAVEGAYIRGNRMLEKRRDVMATWDAYCLSEKKK